MISKRCKYALKALVRIAREEEKGLVQTHHIAHVETIPKKFLEQIMMQLKAGGFLKSKQGLGGGWQLAKNPKKISVADIHRLIDGPIAPVPCVSLNFYKKCNDCRNEKTCIFRREFMSIRDGARIVMSKTTIQSFLDSAKRGYGYMPSRR